MATTKQATVLVKFRRSQQQVTFEQRDKPFGRARLIGVAQVSGQAPIEMFSTPKGQRPFCARVKVDRGLYAHYFAETPGKAFAGATLHL